MKQVLLPSMLIPVPCTVTTGNGNSIISVNNLRHEFLLSFFALVSCWNSTVLVRSRAESRAGTYDRRLSRFCALLHSFLLTHLCMSDDDRRLEDVKLESRDLSEQAQEALERAQHLSRHGGLPEYAASFGEWHLNWSRHFSRGFNINEQDLSTCYLQAFDSVNGLVSGPSPEVLWQVRNPGSR